MPSCAPSTLLTERKSCMQKRYTISELQSLTNINKRTIHFYSQKGLIPSPDSRGGGATYPEEALRRLQLIKELQKRRFTLDEIKSILEKDREVLNEMLNPPIAESRQEPMQEVRSKEELSDYLMTKIGRMADVAMSYKPDFYSLDKITPPSFPLSFKKEDIKRHYFTEEKVRRILLEEGIELNIKEETYLKNQRLIKKCIAELKRLLSEEGLTNERR